MNIRETKLADVIRASLDHGDDSPEIHEALGRLEKKDRPLVELMILMGHLGDEVHRERYEARQAELENE